MKRTFLSILFLALFQYLSFAQADSFDGDVKAMDIVLNVQGYQVAGGPLDQDPLRGGFTSKRTFLQTDSSFMVRIALSTILYDRDKESSVKTDRQKKSGTAYLKPSKRERLLKKFGADKGAFSYNKKGSSIFSYHGYSLVWGARLFSNGGVMVIEVYQQADSREKITPRRMEKLASTLIKFKD